MSFNVPIVNPKSKSYLIAFHSNHQDQCGSRVPSHGQLIESHQDSMVPSTRALEAQKRNRLRINGGYSKGDPPLTIPNREVKPLRADGTAVRWESRSLPIFKTQARKFSCGPFLFPKTHWSTCFTHFQLYDI